jgi:hypothetical protein
MTTQKVRLWAVPLFVLLCLITAGQIFVTQHQQANAAQALTAQRGSLAGDVDTLRTQVRYCRTHPHASYCQQPAAPPPQVRISQHPAQPVIVVGQSGATGQPGQAGQRGPGPTDAQTRDAVAKYLALHPVHDGRDGTDGTPGTSPVCLTSPSACVGPSGPVGPVGPKGDTGDTGQAGQDGKNGSDGRDGVSITDAHVNSDCHLIITYSTGRTEDAGAIQCPAATNATPDATGSP